MQEILSRRCLGAMALLAAAMLAACKESPSSNAAPPFAGPGASPSPSAQATPGSPRASLVVTDGSGASGPFRLSSLARFEVDLAYRGAPGSHAVRLDVMNPAGTLYTQVKGHLSAGADGRGTSRHGLEVAGTPIESFRMTGPWQFSLVVDGVPLASATVDVRE